MASTSRRPRWPTSRSTMLDTERADQKVLATKRKRSNKGYATASTADSHGIMVWWYKALRCKDKSVLETLDLPPPRRNAREAAQATLETQTEGTSIRHNRVIVAQSAANAVKSAQALVPVCDRKAKDVPTWVAFSTRAHGRDKCCLGSRPACRRVRATACLHACAGAHRVSIAAQRRRGHPVERCTKSSSAARNDAPRCRRRARALRSAGQEPRRAAPAPRASSSRLSRRAAMRVRRARAAH